MRILDDVQNKMSKKYHVNLYSTYFGFRVIDNEKENVLPCAPVHPTAHCSPNFI